GTFNMSGGTIEGFEAVGNGSANSYGPSGAGVYNVGTFTLSGTGLITGNVCTGSTSTTESGQGNIYTSSSTGSGMGGGVYNAGEFTMNGGTISNNSAVLGGGVYNAGARNLTSSYSETAGTFTMTGGTITGNSVFSDSVYNASSGSGTGIMGSKGTLVAGVGSELYVGGGSTTVLSGGTIDTDQVNTVETTDSSGNTVEKTVSVGIAVVPTISTSGNASGSSFTATVATNSNLTIRDGANIKVGILLVSTSTVYMSGTLDTETYNETGEIVCSDASETSRTSDTDGLSYLLLDGKMGNSMKLDVAALSVDATTYSFTNVSATGSSYPSSNTVSQISLNNDGALVAAYDDGVGTDEADADHFTLADAAVYLSTYAISDGTTADAWVLCTHSAGLTHVAAVAAACTEDGNAEYWYCETCGALFANEDGTQETTLETVTIPATGHDEDLTYVAAKAATCGADGNIAYYYCASCGQRFNGWNISTAAQLSEADVTIAATGEHTWN
ncbi:MAG: hypothetical protein LUD69_01930, partial [Oscillospiraceae bacterium]|nr:hypothetical protein [Oscillospiraceae bacterium]